MVHHNFNLDYLFHKRINVDIYGGSL